MLVIKPPITRAPVEVLYHPDGRLLIDYNQQYHQCRTGSHHTTGLYRTYILESDNTWAVIYSRSQRGSNYGQHFPWDACWEVDTFRNIGMTLRFNDSDRAHQNAKWRLTTDHDEHQRQAVKCLYFHRIHYGYYHVRAFRTGLWLDFVGNTTSGPHPRLVAKIILKDGWWRDCWHPPSSHPGFVAEWTEYPIDDDESSNYSSAIFCPDMGRHYRVNTRSLWDSYGNRYTTPNGTHIVHAVVRGNVLAVSLAKGNLVVAQYLKTLPYDWTREASKAVPASSVVFLDPDTLEIQKEMSFCESVVKPDTKPRRGDPDKFALMAISPDCLKLVMVGRKRIREIDLD